MKNLVLLTLTLFSCYLTLAADNKAPELPDYRIISDEIDKNLWIHQAKITVHVGANATLTTNKIIYGYDDFSKTKIMDQSNQISFRIRPGKHKFAFYIDSTFREIFTQEITVDRQHHITIQLNFKSTTTIQTVRKPVIYLYSDEERNCSVDVKPEGNFSFTYPKTVNGHWDVAVGPNGMQVNDQPYNYLFWESEQELSEHDFNLTQGSVLSGNQIQDFLEKSLTMLGLTSIEKADFITYWAPQMQNHESLFVQLLVDDACDLFGDLIITPTPQSLHRIYIVWHTNPPKYLLPTPQILEEFKRGEFDVLEWGGLELSLERSAL